jgi:prohibitin 1
MGVFYIYRTSILIIMQYRTLLSVALISLFLTGCAVIKPGEVGVKQRLGRLSDKTHTQGSVWFNPFTTKVV